MGKINKQRRQHFIYALLVFIATLCMGIGYASVNGVLVAIEGTASAMDAGSVHISAALYDSNSGADTEHSRIIDFTGTVLNSSITLGNNSSSTITYAVTIENTTNSNFKYTGASHVNDTQFYNNNNITYNVTGIAVGDDLASNSSVTAYITFSYVGSNTSNPTLDSFISFNFSEYYTITYLHVDTVGKNYPTYFIDGEGSKTVTFTGDIPCDVEVSPNAVRGVNFDYSGSTMTLTDIENNITVDRYYCITYNLDGGTNPQNQPTKYLYDNPVTFLSPTQGSFPFVAWYLNSGFTGNSVSNTSGMSGDITVYAKFNYWVTATNFIVNLVGDADNTSTALISLTAPSGATCTNTLAYDGTTDKNLRYVGTDPCNYVNFNCNGSTCEQWRIVGVMYDVDTNPVLKLVKQSTAKRKWHNGNANDWNSSALNTYLNGDYLNSFNSNVISDYVLNTQWRIGGINYTSNVSNAYTGEKGTMSNAAYIGIINASDYGFATSNRTTCLTTGLNNLASTCADNNYLFFKVNSTSQHQWIINKYTSGKNVLYITDVGKVTRQKADSEYYYWNTIYLKSDVLIDAKHGNGSTGSPYNLAPSS